MVQRRDLDDDEPLANNHRDTFCENISPKKVSISLDRKNWTFDSNLIELNR